MKIKRTFIEKFNISKFHSLFLGLFFAVTAVPFTLLGILIIFKYGTESSLLCIPFLGIVGSLLSGLYFMSQSEEDEKQNSCRFIP